MSGEMGILANGSAEAALAETILWMALKGTAVLGTAFLAAFCLKRCSAALRHLTWAAAFAFLLILPLWTMALPSWETGLLPSVWNGAAPSPQSVESRAESAAMSVGTPRTVSQASLNALPATTVAGRYPGLPKSGPAALLTIWLLAAALLLLRWSAGLWTLKRIVQCSREVREPQWRSLLTRLCRRLGIARPVSLRIGGPNQMPLAWGLRRPGVLLPGEALQWDDAKREMVLLHELAHIQRRDVLVQHLTALVTALYWFNPLVWAAAGSLRREREGACDDLVLSLGARPSEYARQLLSLARHMRSSRFATAPAMARPSQLEGRLLAILDPGRIRRGNSPWTLPAAGLAVLLTAAPVAALSPSLQVAAQSRPTGTSASVSSASGEARASAASPQTAASSKSGSRSGTVSESNEGGRLEIHMQGVRISDDYSRLIGIDPGGYLEISQRGHGMRRRLEIEPAADGSLNRSFYVDGEKSDSSSEAEDLLQEGLRTLRRIDQEHAKVRVEAEQLRREQAHMQAEMERSRGEMEQAMREAEQAVAESHRRMEEARRQLEQTLKESRVTRENDLAEAERELARTRKEMERAMQESQVAREDEMAHVQEELARAHQQLQEQSERMHREMEQAMHDLQEERQRLFEYRAEAHEAVVETALQALGRTGLRDDAAAWAKLSAEAGELASEILSASSIHVEDESLELSANSRRLSEIISRFLNQTLPTELSGLDEALRTQVEHAVQELSTKLADFRVKR